MEYTLVDDIFQPYHLVVFLAISKLCKRPYPGQWDIYDSILLTVLIGDTLIRLLSRWTSYKFHYMKDPLSTIFVAFLVGTMIICSILAFNESLQEFMKWSQYRNQSPFHFLLNSLIIFLKTLTLRVVQIPFV